MVFLPLTVDPCVIEIMLCIPFELLLLPLTVDPCISHEVQCSLLLISYTFISMLVDCFFFFIIKILVFTSHTFLSGLFWQSCQKTLGHLLKLSSADCLVCSCFFLFLPLKTILVQLVLCSSCSWLCSIIILRFTCLLFVLTVWLCLLCNLFVVCAHCMAFPLVQFKSFVRALCC